MCPFLCQTFIGISPPTLSSCLVYFFVIFKCIYTVCVGTLAVARIVLLNFITHITYAGKFILWTSTLCKFHLPPVTSYLPSVSTTELHLNWRWLSGSSINPTGLALRATFSRIVQSNLPWNYRSSDQVQYGVMAIKLQIRSGRQV
jgi:hypothetical protein